MSHPYTEEQLVEQPTVRCWRSYVGGAKEEFLIKLNVHGSCKVLIFKGFLFK